MNEEWTAGMEGYVDTADEELAAALDLPDNPTLLALREDDDEPTYRHYRYDPQTVPPWTPALVFDVALGLEDEDTLFARHSLTKQDWENINTHPMFLRQVAEQARDMGESGLSFKAKAKIQAEMYLTDIDRMVSSPATDQKVRLEAIRSMVKWGGLEPIPNKEDGAGVTQVNLQIIM